MSTGSPAAPQFDVRAAGGGLAAHPRSGSPRKTEIAFGVVLCTVATLEFVLYLSPDVLAWVFGANNVPTLQSEWLRPILCGSLGIAAFFLLRTAVRVASRALDRSSSSSGSSNTVATSTDRFVAEAQRLHIDPLIARETFQLLASLLPVERLAGVNDDLRRTLRLSDQQVDSLLSELPDLCDRSRLPVNAASVLSVYDLLHHMESLPKSTSGQFYTRTGLPVQAAMTLPTSPLADLQNASPRDSRFRTRAHFSGVKRRASDYSGPYRRSTDRRPDEDYAGPFRRASDRESAGSNGPDARVSERRSSERRGTGSQEDPDQARQHRAVTADSSLLNQCVELSKAQSGSETNRNLLGTKA